MTSAITETLSGSNNDSLLEADDFLAGGVVLVVVDDGSSRLMNLGGTFFGLPPVSTDMLLAVLRNGTAQAIVDIATRYGVTEERVRTDLFRFLEDLSRRKLLVRRSECGRAWLHRYADTAFLQGLRLAAVPLRLRLPGMGHAHLGVDLASTLRMGTIRRPMGTTRPNKASTRRLGRDRHRDQAHRPVHSGRGRGTPGTCRMQRTGACLLGSAPRARPARQISRWCRFVPISWPLLV